MSTQRRKGGTHGSLSKAGKIRGVIAHQPKYRIEMKGLVKVKRPHKKKHDSPRVANRKKYERRFSRGRYTAPNNSASGRRRR